MIDGNKTLIIRQADRVWHKLVAYQFNQRCALCGKPGTDPHHWWFIRSIQQYRWDINNGVYLCRKCHGETEREPDKLLDFIGERYPIMWTWAQTRPPLESHRVSEGHVWDVYMELQRVAIGLGIISKTATYMPRYFIREKKK
jgi:hypothetical protein